MYKRRKVFSKIGEKTFSTTEFQTQKEFAAKKEESKKEKVAKAATIGGATVGLGAGAAGLGAEIGRKKVKKGIAKAEKELVTAGGGIKARKATSEAIDKMKKSEKILEKVSKKGTKAGIAGVGASVAGAVAYKALKKKKDQKEFAEKKDKKEGEKAKKAGKAMAGAGAALLAGSNVVGAKVGLKRGKAVEKIAEKTGTINIGGNGITAPARYVKFGEGAQEAANKAAKLDERHAKKVAKVMKRANKVGAVGAGLAAAGAGTYLYGKHKAKKGEDQKEFAEKKEDGKKESKKISKSDKANIWIAKNLTTKKDREAAIKAYDKDSKDFGPLAKRTAVGAGIGGGIVGAGLGAVAGPELIGKTSKHVKKKMAAGGAAGALGFGALSAGSAYAGSKLGGKLVNKIRSKSEKADKKYQKTADINKVASGKMTKEEFAEKYGK